MNLSEHRTRLRQALGDEAAARYPDALLDEGLRRALGEYERACPRLCSGSLSAGGTRRLALGLADLLEVLQVLLPEEDETPAGGWYVSRAAQGEELHFSGAQAPAAGMALGVVYTARRRLEGLDGAPSTSVESAHEGLLSLGAAGHCLALRAAQLAEQYGKSPAQVNRLAQEGAACLALFREGLAALGAAALRQQARPGTGRSTEWNPARWDLEEAP